MAAISDLLPAILLFAYLGLLAAVVLLYGRLRDQTMEEYAVAGRSYPWWMMLFTVLATFIIASFYTSWFALAGSSGALAFYIVLYAVAGLVIYYAIAPRIWKWGKLHDLYNMPDFIRLRFNSPTLGILVAIGAIVIGAPWQVLSIKTFGMLMYEATNGTVPFDIGMGIITAVVLGYIVFSGMRSVVVTDFIQGIIATIAIFVAIFWIANGLFGGYGSLLNQVAAEQPGLLVVQGSTGYWASIILTGAIGAYAWLEVFNRIFLAKSVKEVKKVAVGGPILVVVSSFLVLVLGLGIGFVPEAASAGERALFVMAESVGGPILLAGIGVIVLAAGMSSIDSQLATVGIVTSWNIVKELKPDISNQRAVNVSRIVIVAWVGTAYYLATLELPLLANIAIWTYEGIVHLFPPIALGLFWKRGNAKAALLGIIVGLVTTYSINFMLAPGVGAPVAELGGFTGAIVGLPLNVGIYVVGAYLGSDVEYVDELFDEVAEYDGESLDVEGREEVLDQYDPIKMQPEDD
jgi:SSS family solute:Na+ symporter